MPSAVSILVSLRTATSGALIDVQLALRRLQNDATAGDKALKNLRGGLTGLAPAAIPVAAALAGAIGPVVAQLGAAGVAAGAFAAAMGPQIKTMGDAASAHDKYTDALASSGAASKETAQAEKGYLDQVSSMPQATRRAAIALEGLTDSYTKWSDSLAGDTMPVAIKGFAILETVIPRLTPLVKSASGQFQRLEDVLAGGLQAPGLDKLNREFDQFAEKSLKKTVDEILHFGRVVSQGDFNHGPLNEFLTYAKANAPQVKETLTRVAEALLHIAEAATNAGPGMLTVVNALAGIAAAIPAPVLTRMIQLYTALRLIKGTAAGVVAVTSAVGRLSRSIAAAGTASAAAGGGIAGVRAALASLSTGTKVAGAIAVVAGIVLVLKKLGDSKTAPPSVDRLTTSLGVLGKTGKTTGEGLRVFGKGFTDLNYDIDRLSGKASGMDKFNDSMNKVFTLGMGSSNSAKKASKDIDALDKALAQMVQGGKADLAAAAVAKLSAEYAKGGEPAKNLTKKLDDYKSALADAKFESDLTADSMGLFGKQAQDVQAKLDKQKQSADGLRQSIQALNDTNRAGLGAMSDYEQAIDDATAAIKGHRNALHYSNGELDLSTQKARDAYAPLADLAAKTDAATAAARDQGKSWGEVGAIYDRGRATLIKTATQMGLTRDQAKALADEILKAPADKTTFLKGDLQDLQAKLAKAKADLKAAPASKKTALRGDIVDLQNKIAAAQKKINGLHGKTVTIVYKGLQSGSGVAVAGGGRYAHGGVVGAASGGPRSRMTLVGEQGPELVDLAAGSRVHTANATRQILGGGGGGGTVVVENVITLDGMVLARQLLEPQRQLVQQVAGGDVQKAYGRRSG